MVSTKTRKLDKSAVLRATIHFLKAHNGTSNLQYLQTQQSKQKVMSLWYQISIFFYELRLVVISVNDESVSYSTQMCVHTLVVCFVEYKPVTYWNLHP